MGEASTTHCCVASFASAYVSSLEAVSANVQMKRAVSMLEGKYVNKERAGTRAALTVMHNFLCHVRGGLSVSLSLSLFLAHSLARLLALHTAVGRACIGSRSPTQRSHCGRSEVVTDGVPVGLRSSLMVHQLTNSHRQARPLRTRDLGQIPS